MPALTEATKDIQARKFAQQLIKVGSQKKLAKKLGVTTQAISKKLNQPYVKSRFGAILDRYGATDARIAKKIRDGLEAKKILLDGIETPDYATQHRFVETALRCKGYLNPDAEDKKTNGGVVIGIQIIAPEGRAIDMKAIEI